MWEKHVTEIRKLNEITHAAVYTRFSILVGGLFAGKTCHEKTKNLANLFFFRVDVFFRVFFVGGFFFAWGNMVFFSGPTCSKYVYIDIALARVTM